MKKATKAAIFVTAAAALYGAAAVTNIAAFVAFFITVTSL